MTTTTNADRLALADRLDAAVTHEGAPVYPYGDGRFRKLIVSAAAALRAQPADAGVREKEIIERCAQEADRALELAEQHYGVAESVGASIAARRIRALNVAPPARPALNDPVVDPRNSDEGEYTSFQLAKMIEAILPSVGGAERKVLELAINRLERV